MFNVQVRAPSCKKCLCFALRSRALQGETLGIFTLTVFFVALTMMGFRWRVTCDVQGSIVTKLTSLRKFCEMLAAGRLRWGAVLPILANAHGVYVKCRPSLTHYNILCSYYHWWVSFNYLNESWYQYWYSQWIFGATECAVMYVLFLRLDLRFKLEPIHVTIVLTIAAFHIVQVPTRLTCLTAQPCFWYVVMRGAGAHDAGADQRSLLARHRHHLEVRALLKRKPQLPRFQNTDSCPPLRDLFFVLGDIVCVCVTVQVLYRPFAANAPAPQMRMCRRCVTARGAATRACCSITRSCCAICA